MFGNITIYKVTHLKVHSKGRYFIFFLNPFSITKTNGSFGLQSWFPVFVTSQIVNPTYWNSTGWALHVSKSKPERVFIYHCISDGNQLFSENVGCHFHFLLHVMSDNAVFVSGALFCVQCYRGNLALYHYSTASRCQRIHPHICGRK